MHLQQTLQQRMVAYFASGIKAARTIGGEFEHFVVRRDTLESYNYYEPEGIRDILIQLKQRGWRTNQEDDKLMFLENGDATITLEPGGQLELSVFPKSTIQEVEAIYRAFVSDVQGVLKPHQALVSMGFHPRTRIEDIPFIPKSRYKAMSEYFQTKGQYAHHMMKGTASTQVGIDYDSEEDCGKKLRVFTLLAPILAAYFDSGARWQGRTYLDHTLRTKIWRETDADRAGAPIGVFNRPWYFSDYADYVLQVPPILMQQGDTVFETRGQNLKEIATWLPAKLAVSELPDNLLEHAMTMVFPDVRLKKFLEIRMADALPYPYNFAVLELVWAIAYQPERLDRLYQWSLGLTPERLEALRGAVIEKGLEAPIPRPIAATISEADGHGEAVTCGQFMSNLVAEVLAAHPEFSHLRAFDEVGKGRMGYQQYLKTLSDAALLAEVEVKL